jgi:hypothetical protein
MMQHRFQLLFLSLYSAKFKKNLHSGVAPCCSGPGSVSALLAKPAPEKYALFLILFTRVPNASAIILSYFQI